VSVWADGVLQDSVEVPLVVVLVNAILDEDNVHVRLPVGATVRPTVPVNPLRPVTVIVEVPAVPELTVTVVGLAETEKSWKANVTVVELVVVPLAAETVSVSVSATVPAQVRIDVPLVPNVTVFVLSEQVELPAAATVSVTVPVNPPRDATVIVDVPPVVPTFAVTLVGLALRSIPGVMGTVTVTEMAAVLFVMRLLVPPTPVIEAV
jgi:hypothetical protein